jgi:4-nitrophenyl phosphatase
MTEVDLSMVRGLIFDMDGVLWKDNQPIGNLRKIFQQIDQLDLKVVLATNNATASINSFLDKLAGFGVELKPWQVISSSIVVAQYLCDRYPAGGNVYAVGEAGLKETLAEAGFKHTHKGEIVAVVAGMDRQITYEKLKIATLLIRRGVPFIGTNPDPTFPSPEGLIPGAGSILAAIETAAGVSPKIMGKPEPEIYEVCLERMGLTPDETIAVGDRLSTDIACAQRVGVISGLVLSGVTSRDQAEAWKPKIDWIGSDLTELVNELVDYS